MKERKAIGQLNNSDIGYQSFAIRREGIPRKKITFTERITSP
jgi:hypothetical protein